MFGRPNKKATLGGLLAVLAMVLLTSNLPASAARPGANTPAPPTLADRPQSQASAIGSLDCLAGNIFNLRATDGRITIPDGASVYIWGFTDSLTGVAQLPGPTLCVTQGAAVTINLTNELAEPVSITFPGQQGVLANGIPVQPQFDVGGNLVSLTNFASTGQTVSYSFVASEPGTYIYESGTNPHKQVQMGLYGAIIVRPAGHPDWAYSDPATQFDPNREYLFVFQEIDPNLHLQVELGLPYDVTKFLPRYWVITGRAFPDNLAPNRVSYLPNQPYSSLVRTRPYDPNPLSPYSKPVLLRYANPGMANHPLHTHGNHVRVIAHDGRLLQSAPGKGIDLAYERFTLTVGSGQTYDALFDWKNEEGWSASNPVPVLIPELQNLVFPGTWYSGSPYLGDLGPLPPGTTSYNECGEYYHPWHSHADFEMVNWTEMGGLLTLLRIDPPGGCP